MLTKRKDDPLSNVTRDDFRQHSTVLFGKLDQIHESMNRLVLKKDLEQRQNIEASLENVGIPERIREASKEEEAERDRDRRNPNQTLINVISGLLGGAVPALVNAVGDYVVRGLNVFLERFGLPTIPEEEKEVTPKPERISPAPTYTPPVPERVPSTSSPSTATREPPVRTSAPTSAGPRRARTLGNLLQRGESGRANYNAINIPRGPGSSAGYRSGERDLSSMTVGEVREAQRNRQMFAVGRYQIIPSTLDQAVTTMGLSDRTLFTPELQDRIYSEFLINSKRPAIAAYLTGRSDDVNAAAQAVAQEWASVGVAPGARTAHGRGGREGRTSYYDGIGGNSASISHGEIVEALRQDRSQTAEPNRTASSGEALQSVSSSAAPRRRVSMAVTDTPARTTTTTTQAQTGGDAAWMSFLTARNNDATLALADASSFSQTGWQHRF